MERYHSYGRPTHTNLDSWHKCCMHECPLQPNKESSFTNNKQNHTKLLSIFNLCSMAVKDPFTRHISPPQASYISQTGKCQSQKSTSTRVLMKECNQRNSQKLNTQCSQCRPRTGVNLVVPMMRHSIYSSLHITFLHKKVTCIFIFHKKSHYY
jgi:hypothetical protein